MQPNIELSSRAESKRESQFCRQPEETVEVRNSRGLLQRFVMSNLVLADHADSSMGYCAPYFSLSPRIVGVKQLECPYAS